MEIGGLQKTTLIDYPGHVAATVFLIGCNFRCPFCYSPELVLEDKIKTQPRIPERDFFKFLQDRRDMLEGIVVCGGEPTIHKELPLFLEKIKKLGYLVKLDTNGSNPKMLNSLIRKELVDYVAMDVKAPKDKYKMSVGVEINLENIEKSVDILREGIVDYEFRTTVVPRILKKEDVIKIARWLSPAKKYYLQNFIQGKAIDSKMEKVRPYPPKYLLSIAREISNLFEICQAR